MRELQFNLIPIRDWNPEELSDQQVSDLELQFNLIPIRDWNMQTIEFDFPRSLQFNLIPIRDWNPCKNREYFISTHIAI